MKALGFWKGATVPKVVPAFKVVPLPIPWFVTLELLA